MKTIIAGLIISFALALAPAPRITIENPKLLFAAAMYKTAVGDTDSALRLVHRAEQAQQSKPAVRYNPLQAAALQSALCTIL
jgi:hypothetical protein